MTRYKILDDLLSNRYHNYSLNDLTNEVNRRLAELYPDADGVVRRTIEKDIQYLEYEGPFAAEFNRYKVEGYDTEKQKSISKHCIRYADPSFSIFKKQLSEEEKYILKSALSVMGQFEGLPNLDALEKLQLSLGAGEFDRQIISFSKSPIEHNSLFGQLFTTISQKQAIKLRYHRFGEKECSREIDVYPHLLKEYNHRWYLIVTAEHDGKMLNFGLDRIDEVIPLPSHPYKAFDGDINERFEDIIGVTFKEESPVYKIYFWVSDNSKYYVESKPLHESQRNVPKEKESELRTKYPTLQSGKFFRIDCKENYELIRELTSFGSDLVVVEPLEIQKLVFERIDNINAIYKTIRI